MGLRGTKPHVREKAASDIEAEIRSGSLWGQRLPAERELAARLGVSRFTLQAALSVLEARGVIVRRHGAGTFAAEKPSARGGQKGSSGPVAIVAERGALDGEGWSYHGDMVRGALRGAARHGLEARMLAVEDIWADGPGGRWAELKACAGFVVVRAENLRLVHELLRLRRGPVAVLDNNPRDVPVISVVDGSFEGARRAVRYLARLGHRRIGFLAPGETPDDPHPKSHGYRSALAESGIAYDPALVFPDIDRLTDDHVPPAVREMLALAEPPTAIFAGTDMKAVRARATLEGMGLAAGRDIALMGFGDTASRSGLDEGLSSVRILTRRMGEMGVSALVEAGRQPAARNVIVPDCLVIRGSTCPPPLARAKTGTARNGAHA